MRQERGGVDFSAYRNNTWNYGLRTAVDEDGYLQKFGKKWQLQPDGSLQQVDRELETTKPEIAAAD